MDERHGLSAEDMIDLYAFQQCRDSEGHGNRNRFVSLDASDVARIREAIGLDVRAVILKTQWDLTRADTKYASANTKFYTPYECRCLFVDEQGAPSVVVANHGQYGPNPIRYGMLEESDHGVAHVHGAQGMDRSEAFASFDAWCQDNDMRSVHERVCKEKGIKLVSRCDELIASQSPVGSTREWKRDVPYDSCIKDALAIDAKQGFIRLDDGVAKNMCAGIAGLHPVAATLRVNLDEIRCDGSYPYDMNVYVMRDGEPYEINCSAMTNSNTYDCDVNELHDRAGQLQAVSVFDADTCLQDCDELLDAMSKANETMDLPSYYFDAQRDAACFDETGRFDSDAYEAYVASVKEMFAPVDTRPGNNEQGGGPQPQKVPLPPEPEDEESKDPVDEPPAQVIREEDDERLKRLREIADSMKEEPQDSDEFSL